jgi:prepilin-type N-terminal cleavage/methylation domain-containing protein
MTGGWRRQLRECGGHGRRGCVTEVRSVIGASRKGFTLIELVVVIGVISLLVAISLPSVSGLITDSNRAGAVNTIKGLIKSARARATNNVESGLFFFLENGVQKIVFIEAYPADFTDSNNDPSDDPDLNFDGSNAPIVEWDAADRFRIAADQVYRIPRPYRFAPLAVLDDPEATGDWTDRELSNDVYDDWAFLNDNDPSTEADGSENHRNFFTILFGSDGRLIVGRTVFISDMPDAEDIIELAQDGASGKVTRLFVNNCRNFQDVEGDQGNFSNGVGLPHVVFSSDGSNNNRVALNFPSVDGALLYDDEIFQNTSEDAGARRTFLTDAGRPFFISPLSGAVIAGDVGLLEESN